MKVFEDQTTINVTNSSRATFDVCQRKFFYAHVYRDHGITRGGVSEALLFGNLVHKIYELALSGKPAHEILPAIYDMVGKEEEACIAPTDKESIALEKCRACIEVLVPLIMEDAAMILKGNVVIAVERELSREIHCDRFTLVVRGKLDVILQDRRTGHISIMDHKTVGRFESAFYDKASFDHQLSTYAFLVQDLYPDQSSFDVVYNVLRRSGLKRGVKEGRPEFVKKIADDYNNRWDEHHRRIATVRTSRQIANVERDYRSIGLDLYDRMPVQSLISDWRQNMANCAVFSACPYLSICSGGDAVQPDFITATTAFRELEEALD